MVEMEWDARSANGNLPAHNPFWEWTKRFRDLHGNERDLQVAPRLGSLLIEAGFINVAVTTMKLPLCEWGTGKFPAQALPGTMRLTWARWINERDWSDEWFPHPETFYEPWPLAIYSEVADVIGGFFRHHGRGPGGGAEPAFQTLLSHVCGFLWTQRCVY